jgi:hypothetical protein
MKFELKNVPPYIFRRLEFLLSEARSESPVRDQTVTYAMRVISNYCAIGKDAGSGAIKKLNQRISKRALELKQILSHQEWQKATINEHQEPLRDIWAWILKNSRTLSADEVLERFKAFPMVIVTKEEDILLSKAGLRSAGSPEERYRSVGIEIIKSAGIETDPKVLRDLPQK